MSGTAKVRFPRLLIPRDQEVGDSEARESGFGFGTASACTAFNNEFGRPALAGYFRAFAERAPGE